MLTIHVWPKWLKEFLLTHPLYKSPHMGVIVHPYSPINTKCRFVSFPPILLRLRPIAPMARQKYTLRHNLEYKLHRSMDMVRAFYLFL